MNDPNYKVLQQHGYLITTIGETVSIKEVIRWYHFALIAFILLLVCGAIYGATLSEGSFILVQGVFFVFILTMPFYVLFLKINRRVVIRSGSIELQWPWLFSAARYLIPFEDIKSLEFGTARNSDTSYHILMEIDGKKTKRAVLYFSNIKDSDMESLHQFSRALAERCNVKKLKIVA